MRRTAKINALLLKCDEDAVSLEIAYVVARGGGVLEEPAKVIIKNVLENLRSCLDYMAHEIFESYCAEKRKPTRLCFPIRKSAPEFDIAFQQTFPGVKVAAPLVHSLVQSIQPYQSEDGWLGKLNKLNNLNKHEDLADHIHVAGKRVTIERDGSIVGIGPQIGIAPGSTFLGVYINPITRMPGPTGTAKVTVEPWASFHFEGMECPVNVFVSDCIRKVRKFSTALNEQLQA